MQRTLVTLVLAGAAIAPLHASTDSNRSVREAPQILAPNELGISRMAPDLEFAPVSGNVFRLSQLKSGPATVIAFTSTTCPIAQRYAPTLAALDKEYAARGVKFIFVNPIATDSTESIAAAIRTHRLASPYVHDSREQIAASLDARSTVEVFVFDAARTLIYRGAIDDQYGLGYSLDAPKQRYLADALTAILDGRRPSTQVTTAPGCALDLAHNQTASAIAQAAWRLFRSRPTTIC